MTTPTLALAIMLATFYGAVFHLCFGGSWRRLILYLLAGWTGFAVGHLMGTLFDIGGLQIGSLHWLSATVGSAIALLAARWLATRDQEAGT